MKEQKEVKIKKALMDFINKEIVIEGDPKLVSNRKHELVNLLFSLFEQFNKYLNLPKVDGYNDIVL